MYFLIPATQKFPEESTIATHFPGEKTEAPQDKAACSRPHSRKWLSQGGSSHPKFQNRACTTGTSQDGSQNHRGLQGRRYGGSKTPEDAAHSRAPLSLDTHLLPGSISQAHGLATCSGQTPDTEWREVGAGDGRRL